MSDKYDRLAELVLRAVRNELVRHFVTQRGSQAEMRRAIADVLRKHCSPQPKEKPARD